ncbi:hypothetical protein SEA_AJAY_77 [Mycobacterium phage Ajay]|nr:hypothetical protein SEA_AJAY_77 [Mycobacterium phage Ajay]
MNETELKAFNQIIAAIVAGAALMFLITKAVGL